MAMEENLGEGILHVGVDDSGVEERLRAIEARFKVAVAAIGREQATIDIKGNIGDFRRAVEDAKLRLRELEAEEARLNAVASGNDYKAAAAAAQALKALREQRAEQERVVNAYQQGGRALDDWNRKQNDSLRALQASTRATNDREAAERKLAAAQSDAMRIDRERTLQEIQGWQNKIKLQQQYADAAARLDRLTAARDRAQGSDRVRINLDTAKAEADMAALHEKLKLIGERPIEQKVNVDTNNIQKAWNLFRYGRQEIDNTNHSLKDFWNNIKDVNVNIGPMNLGLGAVIQILGALAPALASVAGAAGSLIGVLGSGIVGAAGLGGAALTGFGLAAIGVGSAVHNSLQQLTTFHSALSAFQTAQLQYGPPRGGGLGAQKVALDQAKVAADQRTVTADTAKYGATAIQTAKATDTLASAHLTLSNAQLKATQSGNQTQKALDRMNQIIGQSSPGIQAAEKGWLALAQTWSKLTGSTARTDVGSGLSQLFKSLNADVGFFAKDTNTALNDLTGGWNRWMANLRSGDMRHILDNIFQNFDATIKPMMSGIGHLGDAMIHWFSTMSNYLPGLARGFDSWAGSVDNAAKKTDGWRAASDTLVHSFDSLLHLAGAVGKWLFALFAPGVKPGNNFVDDMTASIDRSAKAMRTLEGQRDLQDFYSRSIQGAKQLWDAISPLGSLFIHLAGLFAPLAETATTIVSWITKAAAAVTGALGPFGVLLRDLTALLLVGRLIGKMSAFIGMWNGIKVAIAGAGTMLERFVLASNAATSGGGIRGGIAAWRSSAPAQAKTASMQMTEALNAGTIKIGDTIVAAHTKGAEILGTAITRAAATGGGELAAGEKAGAAVAGGELAAGEKAGAAVAGGEIAAEERIGGLGIGGGGIGGIGGIGGRIAGGVGLGLTGVLGSQLIGSAIGGKTGSDVSTIGSAASAGAGIGMLFGPEGAIGGALIAGLGAAVLKFAGGDPAKKAGQHFADSFLEPLKGTMTHDLTEAHRHALAAATTAVRKDQRNVQYGVDYGGFGRAATFVAPARRQLEADQKKQGLAGAQAFIAAYNSVRFKGTASFIMDANMMLQKFAEGPARDTAAQAMVAYAARLQQEGKLPKNALQDIVNGLKGVMLGLPPAVANNAKRAAKAIEANLNMHGTEMNFIGFIKSLRTQMGYFNIDPNMTMKNLGDNIRKAEDDLRTDMHSKNTAIRQQAIKDFNLLQSQASDVFGKMVTNIGTHMVNVRNAVSTNTDQAFRVGSSRFSALAKSMAALIGAGAEGTQKGLQNITDQVNAMLKTFGGGRLAPQIVKALSPDVLAAVVSGQVSAGAVSDVGGGNIGHATGGRVPGPVTPDTWTLIDPNGNIGGTVGGGELLIANRHTEKALDLATMMIYGRTAGQMVAGETRPHNTGYATGGIALPLPRGPWYSSPSVDQGVDYPAPAGTPEYAMGTGVVTGEGISGFGPNAPTLAVRTGPLAGRYIYYGHAGPNVVHKGQSVGVGHQITEVGSGIVGISTGPHLEVGFASGPTGNPAGNGASMLALINSLLSGRVPTAAQIGGAGGGALWQDIKAPRVTGSGYFGKALNAALAKVTHAANAFGQRRAASIDQQTGGNWTSVIQQALRIASIKQNIGQWVSMINRQIAHESGGNSRAINLSDINAQHGDPSKGLMQITGSNFSRYALPPYNKNIYEPLSNIIAAIRYIEGTYGGEQAGLQHMIANGGGAYALGGIARIHSHRTTKAPTKSEIDSEARRAERISNEITAAMKAYNSYNESIHHDRPKYKVGSAGHFTGHPARRGASGRMLASTLRWHPSTIKTRGGISRKEFDHLNQLQRRYQLLIHEHPDYKHFLMPPSSATLIPPRDRIGGIGTSDIDEALSAAQTLYENYDQSIRNKTDSKGRVITPSHDELVQDAHYANQVKNLTRLQTNANKRIQDFANIETEIGTLGTYIDNAATNPAGVSYGVDPGRGAKPRLTGRRVRKTAAQWRQILAYWQNKHTAELRTAASDVQRIMKRNPNKFGINYVETLLGSLSQAQSDLQATTTPSSVDDYIASIGDTSKVARMNYRLSLDEGKIIEDDPGTPQREDIISSKPAMSDTQAIMNYYSRLLHRAQTDPRTRGNIPLLTSISDTYNSARSAYQQYADAAKGAASAVGPTQAQLASTAEYAMFQQYAGNVAPAFASNAVATGAAAATALGAAVNPAALPSAGTTGAGTDSGGTTVHLTNHFQTQPQDPHTWSQALAWELQAAI